MARPARSAPLSAIRAAGQPGLDAVDRDLDAVEGFEHLQLLLLQIQDLVRLGGELVGVFLVVLGDHGELVGVALSMQGDDGVDLVAAIGR